MTILARRGDYVSMQAAQLIIYLKELTVPVPDKAEHSSPKQEQTMEQNHD